MVPALSKIPMKHFRRNEPAWSGIGACCADAPQTPQGREPLRQSAFTDANPALTEVRALYHSACGWQSARPRQIAAFRPFEGLSRSVVLVAKNLHLRPFLLIFD